MPGYIIHLVEDKLIENCVFSRGIIAESAKEKWREKFEYGSLLPDAIDRENKLKTHFMGEKDNGFVVRVPDLEAFVDKYSLMLTNPMVYGYFSHLYLDYMFFDKFFPKYVTFLDVSGREEKRLSKVEFVFIHKTQKKVTLQQFFSEEYLYGDYTKLNYYFIERYNLKILRNQGKFDNRIEEAAECNYEIIINRLDIFLKKTVQLNQELKIFSKEKLERFLIDTAGAFIKEERLMMKNG